MASCVQCTKALQGSWNLTESGETYKRTGRYLGITDGYFLYSGHPHWVYCYCLECWQKEVLKLQFVQAAIQKAATDAPFQQVIQAAQSVNCWNQITQNISQQISTAVTNGYNQTNQLVTSLATSINQNQQNIKTKITQQMNLQNQEVQSFLQNGISNQFSNQQLKTQLSEFIEKTITKINQQDQESIFKEIENKIKFINKQQWEQIVQYLDQTTKQQFQHYSSMMEQTIHDKLMEGQKQQSQQIGGFVQQEIQIDNQIKSQEQQTIICPLLQNLKKIIVESQTLCKIYLSDEGKSIDIIQGIWQDLEVNLVEKTKSSIKNLLEHIQQNYNTAVKKVDIIIKLRDQFNESLKAIGEQDSVDHQSYFKMFEQDIQKYSKDDLYQLLLKIKELL